MYAKTVVTVLMGAFLGLAVGQNETGALGAASIVENNPIGQAYTAVLPETSWYKLENGAVKGSISAVANPDGVGVTFSVTFSNLPTSGGPFPYHLHVDPVPENGNCTATKAHLDPYIRGENTTCENEFPESCQVGDLSGKHGKITSDPFTATFIDNYATTREGLGSFFGNRSFVVHFANKTRITCASFALVAPPTNGSTNSTPTSTNPPPVQFTGAAGITNGASALFILGFATLALFL